MKKTLLLSLAALFFVACGNTQTATAQQSATKSASTEQKTKVTHLTLSEFKQKVANVDSNSTDWKYLGNKPAIIDFYADWCGPCRRLAPILDKLSVEYSDKIVIYKVDTEKERELASIFAIQSLPSLLFIPMNGQPQMAVGALPEEDLKRAITEVLLK